MRKFFSFLGSDTNVGSNGLQNPTTTGQDTGNSIVSSDTSSSSASRIGYLKNRLGRGNRNPPIVSPDLVPSIISGAANALADSVQEIVSDTANLKGDSISGYQTLLDILDDQSFIVDPAEFSRGRGVGCVNILLQYVDHPKFIEICSQANLATVLFQALRLLRMMEIKQSKNCESFEGDCGVTYNASRNICKIMEKLCSKASTIEQVRQLLVKILTFPVGIFPSKGIHIQIHSADIIFAMCKSGFTSQQIWFLHDVQAVNHMVRQLGELVMVTSDSTSNLNASRDGNDSTDFLLRGLAAEREGMWITGIKCVVDVVNAGGGTSSVLLNDFEIAGGSRLFLQILRSCSSRHFLQTLNTMMTMFSGPSKKAEDMLSFTCIPNILSEFLLDTLRLGSGFSAKDKTEKLVEASFAVVDSFGANLEKEHIIQGMSYSLLTLYSNDPANCTSLESNYCFIPTLIVSIPSIPQAETITAVLTTANYVCQCTDYTSEMTLRALCAASAVVVLRATDIHLTLSSRMQAGFQADLLFSSVDAISRSSVNGAETFLRNGLLKLILCDPFEKLCFEVSGGIQVDKLTFDIFKKIVDLIIVLNAKTIAAAEEVRKTGISLSFRKIIASKNISAEFLGTLLRLHEEFSKIDKSYLQESLINIMSWIREIKGSWDKQTIMFESLWKILLESDDSGSMHAREGGFHCAFHVLSCMKGAFAGVCDDLQLAEVLESVVRFLSLLLFLANDDSIDGQFAFCFAKLLVETNIFESPYRSSAIDTMFQFITIFSISPDYIYGPAVDVLSEIITMVSEDVVMLFVNFLVDFMQQNVALNRSILLEADIVQRLLKTFTTEKVQKNESSVQLVKRLVSLLTRGNLTLESGSAMLRYLIRPNLRTSLQSLTNGGYDIAFKAIEEAHSLYFDADLDGIIAPFGNDGPYFSLTVGGQADMSVSNSLAIYFSESSIPFPSMASSVSLWFKLGVSRTEKSAVIIPLIHFESAVNSCSITIELNLETNEVIVTTSQNGNVKEEPARFKPLVSLRTQEWSHLTVCFKRNKRFGSATQVAVYIYMNGVQWTPLNLNSLTTECFSVSPAGGELRIGYAKPTWENVSTVVDPLSLHVGTIALFDEVLNFKDVSFLYFRGPQFFHVYEDQKEDDLLSLSYNGIRIANYVAKSGLNYLEKVGLKGIENIVEPKVERHKDCVDDYELTQLRAPVIIVNPLASHKERLSFSIAKKTDTSRVVKLCTKVRPSRFTLMNVVNYDCNISIATLAPSGGIGNCCSFGMFVASMGGPDSILPFLSAARDESSAICALRLIMYASRQSLYNLRQLHLITYHAIAFLLHQMPRVAITTSTLSVLLDFMVEKSLATGRNLAESAFVLDTSAALALIFNNHIWGAANYSMVVYLLIRIKTMLKDEKYGSVNLMKLSSLGTTRWILMVCFNIVEKAQQLAQRLRSTSIDGWNYKCRSAFEVADFRETGDELFNIATSCIQYIVASELRGKDLDLICCMVQYTFLHSGDGIMSEQDDDNSHELPFCTYSSSRPDRRLSPMEYFRIFLIRLLMTLYEDIAIDESRKSGRKMSNNGVSNKSSYASEQCQLFRQRCNPSWLLSILERSNEIATMSQSLRLLGMFIQRDAEYVREFCELKGYQILYQLLCSKTQEIPVVLPLIGLLFGIPMQLLLHPSQLKSVSRFVNLLDLDDCIGPIINDPTLSEQTLPLLNIFYECLVNAERDHSIKVVELIGGTLKRAFESCSSFRALMQNKIAIEVHLWAMLSCTNAFAEYGTRIFSDANTLDLTSAINDDYIRLSGGVSGLLNPLEFERESYDLSDGNDRNQLDITYALGGHLRQSCLLIMEHGLREQDASKLLYNFFSAYSISFAPSFESSFQIMIINIFEEAVNSVLKVSEDIKSFASIARNIANVIPLMKGCFLYDVASFELLKLNIVIYQRLLKVECKPSFSTQSPAELLVNVLKDFGYNSRYLAFICLQTGIYQYKRGGTLSKFTVLNLIRENIEVFFHRYLEDSNEGFVSTTATGRFLAGRSSMDDRALPSTQVFEALQGLTQGGNGNSQRKSTASNVGQIRSDRNKIAIFFAIFMLNYSYSLVLDDMQAVRFEAIRIIAYICHKRRSLVEQVIGNGASPSNRLRRDDGDDDCDVFRDGFMKLVPNERGEYELTLRGGVDVEESRFADFSYWISDNGSKCDKVFRNIEATLNNILPIFSNEIDELIRVFGLQVNVRDLISMDQAENIRSAIVRSDMAQRNAEKAARQLMSWKNDSVKDLTIGALHWKKIWLKLRSSPLWGYSTANDIESSGVSTAKLSWRVDYSEGPERSRKKTLQDASPFNAALYGSGSKSLTKASTETMKAQENDLQHLLEQMNKQGILRKQSTTFDVEQDDFGEDLTPLQLVETETSGLQVDFNDIDGMENSEFSPLPKFGDDAPLTSQQELLQNIDDKTDDTSSPTISVEGKKIARSMLLREVIKGLIPSHDLKVCSIYNVERVMGLESQRAVLFLSEYSIHVLCGISADDPNRKVADQIFSWVPINTTLDSLVLSGSKHCSVDDLPDDEWLKVVWKDILEAETAHYRFPMEDIYSFFKRRYQLKYSALEITDTKGASVLFSCENATKCDEILTILLEKDLPSSIFNKMVGLKNLQLLRGATNVYNRLVAYFLSSLTALWREGNITNFEYLMHINSAAGRSFLDLTQYPVFPWVLADYQSEELDFDDPSTFRDLSKPMGALGKKRQQQYRDRFQTMDEFFKEEVEGSSPPFHYGTHYSCAGYVLHYLLRLQPYANMSLVLQGGNFDKPDRLFYSVENSWLSASQENLQDVRELIPEFYYLPDFLMNVNGFEFGTTQKDEVINHVSLPKWANGDPKEFIRLHRQALECAHVSENINHWIDLVFGYKQRGKASIDAMNVFIHITYEGEVDLDAIDDPVLRVATLAQINNFGQTPTKIFHKAHPKKMIPEVVKKSNDQLQLDSSALLWHGHLCPPLLVVGARNLVLINKVSTGPAPFIGLSTKVLSNQVVGDIRLLSRDRLVAVPQGSLLLAPFYRKVVKFKTLIDGVAIQTLHTFVAARALESEKECTYHEGLHSRAVTCVATCKYGELIATGSDDMTVRVWKILKTKSNGRKLAEVVVFSGHEDSISCLEISTEFSIVISGGRDRQVCIWDYKAQVMVRALSKHTSPVLSVSVNSISGNIATLTKEQLRIYHLNGELISYQNFIEPMQDLMLNLGKVVLSPPSGEWQDGVAAVTGHKDGNIYLWKLNQSVSPPLVRKSTVDPALHPIGDKFYRKLSIVCQPQKSHKTEITCIRLCSVSGPVLKTKELIRKTYEDSRCLDLLIGDADGQYSRWTSTKLDQLSQQDIHSLCH